MGRLSLVKYLIKFWFDFFIDFCFNFIEKINNYKCQKVRRKAILRMSRIINLRLRLKNNWQAKFKSSQNKDSVYLK